MQPDDALEFHPLATLFPPPGDAEFEALAADIGEQSIAGIARGPPRAPKVIRSSPGAFRRSPG